MSADINPSAVERIADDLLALDDELLHKMGGMKEGIFRNLGNGTFLEEINAGIGIVVILRFLNEPLDVASIKVKDAQFDTDIVRNGRNGHLCIVHLEVEREVLIVDVGVEVGVHHKDSIVIESIYELDTTNRTEKFGLTEGTYLHTIARSGEVLLQLLT